MSSWNAPQKKCYLSLLFSLSFIRGGSISCETKTILAEMSRFHEQWTYSHSSWFPLHFFSPSRLKWAFKSGYFTNPLFAEMCRFGRELYLYFTTLSLHRMLWLVLYLWPVWAPLTFFMTTKTGIYMSIVKIDRNFHVSQNHKCIAMLRNAFRKAAENAILQVLFIGHLLWPQSVTN